MSRWLCELLYIEIKMISISNNQCGIAFSKQILYWDGCLLPIQPKAVSPSCLSYLSASVVSSHACLFLYSIYPNYFSRVKCTGGISRSEERGWMRKWGNENRETKTCVDLHASGGELGAMWKIEGKERARLIVHLFLDSLEKCSRNEKTKWEPWI